MLFFQARVIFDKAVKVPYKHVDDLASVWCEWAEMEIRHEYVFLVLWFKYSQTCLSDHLELVIFVFKQI